VIADEENFNRQNEFALRHVFLDKYCIRCQDTLLVVKDIEQQLTVRFVNLKLMNDWKCPRPFGPMLPSFSCAPKLNMEENEVYHPTNLESNCDEWKSLKDLDGTGQTKSNDQFQGQYYFLLS